MTEQERLREELCFRADGHVADLALSLLADGADDYVPAALREHADQCEECLERLLGLSQLSLEVGSALERWAQPSVRFPLAAFWCALAIPALALGRSYVADERILSAPLRASFALLALVRSLLLAVERGLAQLDTPISVLPVVASVLFVLGGLAIARLAPSAAFGGKIA
jgi:hypothetical protein